MEEILNFMLANTCHHETEAGVSTFTFDLHCMEVIIQAKFVGNWEENDIRYEILDWKYREI